MASRLCTRFLRFCGAESLRNWNSSMKVEGATQCCKRYSSRGIAPARNAEELGPKDYLQRQFDSSRQVALALSEVPREDRVNREMEPSADRNEQIGKNISRRDKVQFLVNLLLDLKESKEAVYGALDAWVAWEQTFPLVSLRRALITLEKEQQWHKVVQVIKWMLSKGQGNTMGTYEQLIRALEKDYRAEEAHAFWGKRIGHDLHSVPWQLCKLMMSIYYRNNMLERLIELFKGLESFNRKPPDKSIVKQVADAYEMLGLLDEQTRILEKYKKLFIETPKGKLKKERKASKKKGDEDKNEKMTERREYQSSESSDDELWSRATEQAG
ncbi:pentatricopeptide repeat-containing protein At4g21190 isoform X2 [Aristolochia californica]|uniref:pentatricopeptide repeat-containing protein At4g21190 isoform X2 n=1 Tax=Aristolochia californica TaxID=171875 RepID=UPI0035D97FFB